MPSLKALKKAASECYIWKHSGLQGLFSAFVGMETEGILINGFKVCIVCFTLILEPQLGLFVKKHLLKELDFRKQWQLLGCEHTHTHTLQKDVKRKIQDFSLCLYS